VVGISRSFLPVAVSFQNVKGRVFDAEIRFPFLLLLLLFRLGVTVQVTIRLAIGVAVANAVAVAVADTIGVAIRVAVADAIGVAVGVAVADAVAMTIADAIGVTIAMTIADAIGVSISVSIGVSVAMAVAMAVADAVAMAVGVLAGQSVRQSVGIAVLVTVRYSISFEGASFVLVGSLVEVGEEAEEEHSVATDPPDESLGVVAVDEEQLEGVHHNSDELDHLEGGEVFLPPDELLVLGSHGSNHVIEVHDNMHECVEQAEEGGMSAGGEANAEPYAHRHDTVVDDMQQRDMLLFLAQHEEERIEEFSELGEVIPPASVDHPHSNGIIGIINGLTLKTVVVEPSAHQALVEEPSAEDDLDEVVNNQ